MGLSGIGPGSLLLILLIVVVLFGTKKLRSIGGDLGSAIKGFRDGMNNTDDNTTTEHHLVDKPSKPPHSSSKSKE